MVKPLGPMPLPAVTDGAPAADRAGVDTCTTCHRTVDEDVIVSHGVRGSHTCKSSAGVVPPYADPATEEERASTEAARARRFARYAADDAAANDPERPFE